MATLMQYDNAIAPADGLPVHSAVKPLRILMLAQFYPPVIGGEEQHVRSLSLALRERGHDVSVITLAHADLPPEEDDHGVRVLRISSTTQKGGGAMFQTSRRHAPPFPDPAVVRAIRRFILAERPQIVHGHNWMLHSFTPLKRWSKAKFVVTLHDYSMRCPTKKLMFMDETLCSGPGIAKCFVCSRQHFGLKGPPVAAANWMMSFAERAAADMFVPVSEAVAEGNGLVGKKVPYRVIPNFVADDIGTRELPHFPQLDSLPDEPYILFVGDLNTTKGADIAIAAYAGIPDAPPLVLIGRAFPEVLKKLPANVHVFHSWPHDAVMQAFRRSLFSLAPSRWAEPFGLVVIEALVSGRPVIASRIGGFPEIIVDGESGFLVPPGDVQALRQAIRTLLENPQQRERMSHAARLRAEDYYASAVIPQIEQMYSGLPGSVI